MSRTKILICGGTGFIGRNVTEYFAGLDGFDVHAVNFNRPAFEIDNVTWHQVDLRDPNSVKDLLNDVSILIQAAATTSGAKDIVTRPYIHVTDNAVMNSYLFQAAFEAQVKHVIFFSCTVMYQSSGSAIRETDFNANEELNERYLGVGQTKLYLENMCKFYASISDTKYTVIRHSNVYGPHDKFDLERSHVFGATITKVMNAEESITVWGTGEEERDLLYISDLVDFIHKSISNQEAHFRIYNCGLGKAVSIKQLVEKIIAASKKALTVKHDTTQPTIKTSLFLNTDRAHSELDWQPKVSLDEGIHKTIAWWKEHIRE